MKNNRGKQVQSHFIDLCSAFASGCEKHPTFVSTGVCAFCLRDRLLSLVCDECGEQRLSCCSSYSFSSPIGDVGSVGRISFLIENDDGTCVTNFDKDRSFGLKRSSSSSAHVEIKRSRSGFWRLSALFRKRKDTDQSRNITNGIWAPVSRSRSLCSFRGGVTSEDGGSMSVSGARSSSVTCTYSEPEHHRRSGHGCRDEILSSFSSQSGKRVSGSKIKESNFEVSGEAASGFIDLNLGSVGREEFGSMSFMYQNGGVLSGGEKKVGGRMRVWRWIFGIHGQRVKSGNVRKKD